MKDLLRKAASRKLFVFLTATALLVFRYLTASEWIIVACAYMGMNVLSAVVNGKTSIVHPSTAGEARAQDDAAADGANNGGEA